MRPTATSRRRCEGGAPVPCPPPPPSPGAPRSRSSPDAAFAPSSSAPGGVPAGGTVRARRPPPVAVAVPPPRCSPPGRGCGGDTRTPTHPHRSLAHPLGTRPAAEALASPFFSTGTFLHAVHRVHARGGPGHPAPGGPVAGRPRPVAAPSQPSPPSPPPRGRCCRCWK